MNTAKTILAAALLLAAAAAVPAQDEREIGLQSDADIHSNQTIVLDPELNRAVRAVGERVAAAAGTSRRYARYTFRILNNPLINAMSTAGGRIYVNTGLLDILDNADQLAVILAHEIVHTNHSHVLKTIMTARRRESNARLFSFFVDLAAAFGSAYLQARANVRNSIGDAVLGQVVGNLGPQVSQAVYFSLAVAAVQGYAREMENEADALALEYVDRAGYDPEAAIALFEKLIAFRNELNTRREPCFSNLVNAQPGLELRRIRARAWLADKKKKTAAAGEKDHE